MENLTNQIFELENGKKYLVLRQAAYKGVSYFLAVAVSEDEKDFVNEFVFLQKVDSEDFYVKEVTDPEILNILAQNIKID